MNKFFLWSCFCVDLTSWRHSGPFPISMVVHSDDANCLQEIVFCICSKNSHYLQYSLVLFLNIVSVFLYFVIYNVQSTLIKKKNLDKGSSYPLHVFLFFNWIGQKIIRAQWGNLGNELSLGHNHRHYKTEILPILEFSREKNIYPI